YKYHTKLIETAGEINNEMTDYVVRRIMEIINEDGKALNGSNILVLGVAYKKDIDDYRESPVLPILEKLDIAGANWTVADPYVKKFKYKGDIKTPVESVTEDMLLNADLVFIATNHSDFNYDEIQTKTKVIFDSRNVFQNSSSDLQSNIYSL